MRWQNYKETGIAMKNALTTIIGRSSCAICKQQFARLYPGKTTLAKEIPEQ